MLAQPKSYPVGKVNIQNLYPLTFAEFLCAVDGSLFAYYEGIEKNQQIEKIFHNKLLDVYRQYLIVGGMPECVAAWIKNRDPEKVAQIQQELIELYENDFSKHNGKVNSGRILLVFRSIVTQLAKDNEKFVYGCVREGARAREFEEAIEWLVSAGMVIRIYNVSKPEHPLAAYEQLNHFKLFLFDVGLLKRMAGVSNEAILLKPDFQFMGPLTENYVLQQIRGAYDGEPKYFAPSATNEIDFVVQDKTDIIPMEVKAGKNVQATSFKNYLQKYQPEKAVRYSQLEYQAEDSFVNIPLYLAGKTRELV